MTKQSSQTDNPLKEKEEKKEKLKQQATIKAEAAISELKSKFPGANVSLRNISVDESGQVSIEIDVEFERSEIIKLKGAIEDEFKKLEDMLKQHKMPLSTSNSTASP